MSEAAIAVLPVAVNVESTRDVPALRRAMKLEASKRHALLVQATRLAAATDKATRFTEGYQGREGYVAWTQEVRDSIREDLDGQEVPLTLRRLNATKRGNRVTVTGVAVTEGGFTVAIRGEATVVDIADASTLEGATVTVRLVARRGERKNGSPFTGFAGESIGLASTGQRIGVKCQVQASRYVRVIASAL